jgi:hypothetical protein
MKDILIRFCFFAADPHRQIFDIYAESVPYSVFGSLSVSVCVCLRQKNKIGSVYSVYPEEAYVFRTEFFRKYPADKYPVPGTQAVPQTPQRFFKNA